MLKISSKRHFSMYWAQRPNAIVQLRTQYKYAIKTNMQSNINAIKNAIKHKVPVASTPFSQSWLNGVEAK